MDWHQRIAVEEGLIAGKPVIRGTRLPVEVVVGSLAQGMTAEEVCQQYRISIEDVKAALACAAEILSEERLIALPRMM